MPITVAIVDDHRLIREALADMIRKTDGYELLYQAENGRDLLEQIQRGKTIPDLALVDLHMPIMDGFATTIQLRQLYSSIRILIVTVSDQQEEIERAFRSGAHGYLIKGLPDELRQALDAVMTNSHYFPDSLKSRVSQDLITSTGKSPTSAIELTNGEMKFLSLACSDLTYQEIADEMDIPLFTLDDYRKSVFAKLKVRTRVGLVLEAIRRGLIQL